MCAVGKCWHSYSDSARLPLCPVIWGEDSRRWGLKGEGAVGYLKQKSREVCLIFGRTNERENHENCGSVGRREMFINRRLFNHFSALFVELTYSSVIY